MSSKEKSISVGDKKLGWKELPEGDILEAGTAEKFKTGDWRNLRPVYHPEKCIHCFICWINCPDSSIITKDGKVVGIDYEHCKGCGICAKECPPKASAITMEEEKK
ncbi:MAG: 4Fe-4S binding protein [Elusimicrobia bacterium]|nr:4Fe-4S binding protein [Elusimicrobiota bacterium]